MKKIFFLTLAAAALISCAKERNNDTPVVKLQELTFTAHSDDGLVKTSLGSDFSILWSNSDWIDVFAGENGGDNNSANNNNGVKFQVLTTSNEGRSATFKGTAPTADTYYALSPSQTAKIYDGLIFAAIPQDQYATIGSFDPEANISVATSTDYTFKFKNVGALIGFTIAQEGISAVRLEAINGGELSGEADIDPADGSVVDKDYGGGYVEMTGSFVNGGTYYFVVYPGTYPDGLRLTLFKGSQYTAFNLPGPYTINRNDNLGLGNLSGNNWKTAFVEGEELVIKGSAEEGQKLAYVGSDGYWNSSVQYSDVDGYAYNYEIFTSLTKDQKFYFKSNGGENFTLNAAGTAVERLAKVANAPYGAPATGIYRIRLNMPDGAAEVKQISEVKYDIYGLDSRQLTYMGNGVWSADNFLMRTSGYMNRYRFLVKFTDDTKQYYGRHRSTGGNPTYGVTEAEYFYVQPSIDSDADHWSPCFQYPSACQDIADRYYCTMTLSLNNDEGHYTHSVTNFWDKMNPLTAGEEVHVWGSAVTSPDVAGVQMRYSTSFYNSAVENYGDRTTTLAAPEGYDYEIFVKLTSGQKFYFSTGSGHNFALNNAGDGIEGIFTENDIQYSGVSTTGVYRIRLKSSTNEASIKQVESVRFLQPDRGSNVELNTYQGNGTWYTYLIRYGWTHPHTDWDNDRRFFIKFQLYYNTESTWQYLGRHTNNTIQPITDTSTEASWNNFLDVRGYAETDDYLETTDKWANVYLKLNADGYRYEFTSIRN